MSFNDILLKARNFTIKHSPEILTGLGIMSMISSTALAIKATPKAKQLITEYETLKEENNEFTEVIEDENYGVYKTNMMEKVKITWKEYVPTILTGLSGTAMILGANGINKKRNMALSAAYTISERTFTKYRDKVAEKIGEKEEKVVKQQTDKEIQKETDVKLLPNARFKIVDGYSGLEMPRNLTYNDVERVVNKLNKTMNFDDYVNLCDWYDELGFKNIPKCAENAGWRLDITGLIEIEKEAGLNELDEPVLIVNFVTKPMQNIDNWG